MDEESRLIADALVTYADTCTLPNLTPSCPYFRDGDDGPTCNEECRDVIARHGGVDRPVESRRIAGLVLHGRSIPVRVAGGIAEFDAARSYLQDRERPPREQSTPSLLLSLRAVLLEHAITGSGTRLAEALELWAELHRRIPAIQRVFIGGLAQAVASAVSTRVVLDHLARKGDLDIDELFGTHPESNGANWLASAEASMQTASSARSRQASRFAPDLDLLMRTVPQLFTSTEDVAVLRSEPIVSHVLSPVFISRVIRWLGNLLPIDLDGALSVRPPTESLFSVLDASEEREAVGRWLWERFTFTSVDDWSYSSLVLEWDFMQKGGTDVCDSRAMAERAVSEERLARLAMQRAASEHLKRRRLPPAFDPALYVRHALGLLVKGDVDAASRIFEGLVELSPGNATTWNNLGFCQLPKDASAALISLRRAEALSRVPSMLATANRALALHLLGQDDEALRAAIETLEATTVIETGPAWVWQHPADNLATSLQLRDVNDVREYLTRLVEHIRDSSCGLGG